MRSFLLAVLLFPILLSASKIVSYEVQPHSDRVDIVFAFDKPYKGKLRKSEAKREIVVKIGDAVIASPEVRKIASPFLSKVSIIPFEKETKLVVNVASKVTMQSAKSTDSLSLRLRFVGPKGLALEQASAKELAAYTRGSSTEKSRSGRFSAFAVYGALIAVLILLPAVGWIVMRRRKKKGAFPHMEEKKQQKREALRNSVSKYLKWPREKLPFLFKSTGTAGGSGKTETSGFKYPAVFNPKNKIITLFAAIVIIALFVPKYNLYYQAEHFIRPHGIILSGEELKDNRLWLTVNDATLYYEQIDSANIKTMDIMLFVLYNRITATDIRLSSTLQAFVPLDISRVVLYHSVLNPLKVFLEGSGDFGELKGEFLLTDRTFKVTLSPSSLMTRRFQSTLNTLKKESTGGYYYESRF